MTIQTHETLEQDIGADGALTIRGLDGLIEVRAVDGSSVRIHGAGTRPLEDDFRVVRSSEGLELTSVGTTGFGLGWLRGRRCQPIKVEAPRGARIRIETASGSIRATGLAGDQRYQSVSGDLRVDVGSARTSIETVSGDIRLRAAIRLVTEVRSVSGDLTVSAATLEAAQVRTTSGDIELGGSFAGPGPYAIGTISGDVTIASAGPVRVEGKTVSGDLRSSLPHRSSGGAGRRMIEIGDGGPLIAFQSISGDLQVIAAPAQISAPAPVADVATPVVADTSAADRPTDGLDDQRMQVLRDLEAGRIAVDDADRRLADLEGADEPAERAPVHDADFSWVRRV